MFVDVYAHSGSMIFFFFFSRFSCRSVLKLEYEAYEPMAVKQMRSVQSIRAEAKGERNALRSSTCGLQHLSTVTDGCVFLCSCSCVCAMCSELCAGIRSRWPNVTKCAILHRTGE